MQGSGGTHIRDEHHLDVRVNVVQAAIAGRVDAAVWRRYVVAPAGGDWPGTEDGEVVVAKA